MRVLIVEDDPMIADNLQEFLALRGNDCVVTSHLLSAREALETSRFDVMILDRSLPDGDGVSLAKQLRLQHSWLPILVLTARDSLNDKLQGFEAGADDYLVKPFALKEVEARLQALIRRNASALGTGPRLKLGRLSYDPAAHVLCCDDQAVTLPPKALRLLATLMSQPNRLFSHRELERAVWGCEQEGSENLRQVLHAARKAVGNAAEIQNSHGLGYKISAP